VVETSAKYDAGAERWTEDEYADPARYLGHRAELIVSLGPELVAGETVLDLACGDGGLADHLLARGLRYRGVDANERMVAAARHRLGERAEIELADLNEYELGAPVAATTCFRAIYYARDRRLLFRRLAGFTDKKLVFDLNPRQYRPDEIRAELEEAGWTRLELRPFFVPQHVRLPASAAALLRAAERGGPLARALLRLRFSYLCAAWR
jgi:SAM-dependent methyltransferase